MPDHLEWPLSHARLNNHWHHILLGRSNHCYSIYIFLFYSNFPSTCHISLNLSTLRHDRCSGFWFRHRRHFSDFSIQPRGLDRKRMKSASTEWFSDRIGIVLDISCRDSPRRQWSLHAWRKTHHTGFSTICVTCKGISHRASPSQAVF